jgi:DNA-binding Xre family transcriptional regulator
MAVLNRFSILLSEKETREKRKIDIKEVSNDTGISRTTLHKYKRQEATRFDGEVIEALCHYFDCKPGQLLVLEEDLMKQ